MRAAGSRTPRSSSCSPARRSGLAPSQVFVGTTLAGKLRELGHEVRVGSRDGSKGGGTFAEVAAHGELLLNCTAGTASLAALEQAGEANLRGNVLVDVANPLDFSAGFPPRLFIAGDDASAKEQVVELLESIGWSRTRVLDLGGVAASRGMEMYLPLWLSLFAKQGSPLLNVQILHGAPSG